MEPTYSNAIALLNSRRRTARSNLTKPSHGSNNRGLDLLPKLSAPPVLKGIPSIVGITDWLQELGHSGDDVNGLNVIHVSGTKGKGSTCAFVSSILKAHGERTGFPHKVGLYTSPHLITPQERIRIDSRPISESLFAKYVFEVWDALSGKVPREPRLLQLFFLVAIHTFIKEGVDAAIIETHHGGEFDATNIVSSPVATGVSKIGMDHVDQLGPSIKDIAWHKAGIFKRGSPAYSSAQEPSTTAVLQMRAEKKNVPLEFVGINPALPSDTIILKPEVQKYNCSLGITLSKAFLHAKAPRESSLLDAQDIGKGIQQFSWPGRFQRIIEGENEWFLDGAHNELSIKEAAKWFVETISEEEKTIPRTRIVIFSHISDRDGAAMLKVAAQILKSSTLEIRHVILSTYSERENESQSIGQRVKAPDKELSLSLQKEYIAAYKAVEPNIHIVVEPRIEGALTLARQIGSSGNGMQTLVTGSLYLIGGVLRLLETEI